MKLDFNKMTLQEAAFVKTYARALNREYDVFVTALNLMRADELTVRCPVRATNMAWKMRELHADFEHALASLADKHKMQNARKLPDYPSLDDLVRVIRISFFKLVEPGSVSQAAKDKGWFSGHPIDWKDSWKTAYHAPSKQTEHPLTVILNAFLKLFEPPSQHYNTKNLPWYGNHPYEEPDDYEDEEDYDE